MQLYIRYAVSAKTLNYFKSRLNKIKTSNRYIMYNFRTEIIEHVPRLGVLLIVLISKNVYLFL